MLADRNWRTFVRDSLVIERRKVPYLEAIREREVEPEPRSNFEEERLSKHSKCQNLEVQNQDSQIWETSQERIIITVTGQNLDKLIHKSPVKIGQKNLDDHPYSALGVVTSRMTNQSVYYLGSGCLIAADLVITCAHNIYRKQRDKIFQEISFIPASMQFNQNHGYKVIDSYIPQQYKESDYSRPDRVNLGHIYDIAILVLDTKGDNLKRKFGTIGYDFRWEDSEQFKEGCQPTIQVIGYPKSKSGIELNSYRGTAYNDKYFLLYLLETKLGMSGAPLLTLGPGGFTVIGIHQRDVGNIVKTSNGSLPTKGGLKLRKEMFKDISHNLVKEVSVQGYDLRDKNITGEQMEKVVAEIDIHQKEIQQQQYLTLWLWGNRISDQGCLHLGAAQWDHLCALGLGSNGISDEGCRYLAQGRWPRLLWLHLGWNKITMNGCVYLAKARYWNSLKTLDLWQNFVNKEERNNLFSNLDWEIKWEFVQQ